ncbi:MAG TPA: haloacid dehalogenase type II [Phycisphaerales bacterium]|nr:haloacid dehalogenase type II [Phycisphaerales bacterium]
MLDPAKYQVLTFDCYGTLIDWEAGMLDALRALLGRHGVPSPGDEELLALHAALEPAAQAGEYRPYRDVLADVTRSLAGSLGVRLAAGEEHTLADSIPRWPAFRDTPKALARLARAYDLAILSNIDRDLFERTRPKLIDGHDFDFAAVITAEDTRSYKPAIGHFWHAIQALGVPGARILHVAQSLYHDVVPAQSMGISTVWVNRRAGRPGGGATPRPASDVEPDLEVPDLRSLAAALLGE